MNLLEKLVAKSAAIPQKTVSNIIFGLGVLIALMLAAQITWKLVPVSEQQSAWQPMPITSSSGGNSIELSAVQKLKLFGKADAEASKPKPRQVEQITDAPKTSLSILLTGVVASTAQNNGLAVIESKGNQETYKLGDRIKGTSASLKEVYADRIIITNSGRYETLMLDGLKYTANSAANQPQQQVNTPTEVKQLDKRSNAEFSQTLAESRDELLADPNKLTDFISISPVRGADGLSGYRLNPGKDLALFTAAGFKANDLAKTINGYDLTDMSQGLEVMAQLPELTEMSVMVEREGQLIEIMFSLPEQ
ncbi:type II secretion system protein GspC [Shewanella maritima]|uniref:type II secretion system protein GspC n=1 Tax=Shewanella maritima TaxID=2520507 RepID=UPI0037351F81